VRRATIVLCMCAVAAHDHAARAGGPPPPPQAVRAMTDELARATGKLELPGIGKPYYLSYELWDEQTASAAASFGALTSSNAAPRRFVDIDLRIGDYALDNSNFSDSFEHRQTVSLGAEDDYDAARHALWLATDRAYKAAGEALDRKQAVMKAEAKDPDEAPSFSKETPVKLAEAAPLAAPELARLEALANKLSAVFRGNPDAYRGTVRVHEVRGNRYFASSEGASAAAAFGEVRVTVTCATQADDGMPLHDSIVFAAPTFDQLPREAEMVAQVDQLSKQLSALRKAPIADDYAGPVVFRGPAAGRVVRTLLAEDVAGTPAPRGNRPGALTIGETELAGKVGQRILPVGVSIADDPTLARLAGQPLTGHFAFDEEGIAARRVSLVEDGVFKRFLMSRTPRKGFEHSTGHGRSTPLSPVRAHPANLIVTSSAGVADRELVRRALAAAKQQGLPYVMAVERIAPPEPGDLDVAMLSDPGFSIGRPSIMKRIYPDGREELVRGAAFAAVQLRALKDLLGVGNSGVPYHYVSSGAGRQFDALFDPPTGIAISIVSPSLVFRDLDVKKPRGAQKKPPIAPRPSP
jgi:TldD protein